MIRTESYFKDAGCRSANFPSNVVEAIMRRSIDLDEKGNLVLANKKPVTEANALELINRSKNESLAWVAEQRKKISKLTKRSTIKQVRKAWDVSDSGKKTKAECEDFLNWKEKDSLQYIADIQDAVLFTKNHFHSKTKKTLGYVWFDDQQRPFSKCDLIERGKYTGRFAVTIGIGKTAFVVVAFARYINPLEGIELGLDRGEQIHKPFTKEQKDMAETITPKSREKKTMAKSNTKKATKAKAEPKMVTHKAYDGKPEEVDFNLYCNKVKCAECGQIRYVKNADVFQVKLCKPCKKNEKKKKKSDNKKKAVAKKANGKKATAKKNDTNIVKLKDVKKGGMFNRKKGAKATFIRGHYVKDTKSFSCQDFDDMNREIFIKAEKEVYVG